MKNITEKKTVQVLVHTAVESFAGGFKARHEGEVDNPEGIINMKVHNVFIEALGKDIQYYTALVRSLDSSLGNMLEGLTINLVKLSLEVKKNWVSEAFRDSIANIKFRKNIPEMALWKSLTQNAL